MSFMFTSAMSFNQPLNFDTKNVTDMSFMFRHAKNFNQPLNFNIENVSNLDDIFEECPISEENKYSGTS